MIRTFVIVTLQTTKNRVLQRVRRLRDPRYVAGALAGLAYIGFMILRNPSHLRDKALSSFQVNQLAIDVVSLAVLALMVLAWALPGDSGGLTFSEAEIAFLFPAPLRRRDLLLYKVIRAQPQAMISALAFMIFGWTRGKFVGLWLAISVLSIYFILVALGRARLRQMHIGFIPRVLTVGVILVLACTYAVTHFSPTLRKLETFADTMAVVQHLDSPFREPAIRAVLFVPSLFASAVLPRDAGVLATSSAGLIALGVVFFFLAARLNVSFEEASINAAARRLSRLERMREQQVGKRVVFRRAPPLFRLRPTGPPEVAIVWKNVIALMRTSLLWIVLLLCLTVAMIVAGFRSHEPGGYVAIAMFFVMMAAIFPLTGPQFFANDLRLDLIRAEILKSYPITGERLVAAEIAAPLVVIAAFEMLFATMASVMLQIGGVVKPGLRFIATPQFIVTALILALPVCAVQLLIRNAVPLYFPAWTIRAKDDTRGFVAAGQRFIVLFANLFTLCIVLVPAAMVFLPSMWIAHRFFAGSPAFVAVATMPAAVVVASEAWLGVKMLGARFDQIDVSNEFDIVTV